MIIKPVGKGIISKGPHESEISGRRAFKIDIGCQVQDMGCVINQKTIGPVDVTGIFFCDAVFVDPDIVRPGGVVRSAPDSETCFR